jgi:hypothetical protein
MRSNSLFHQPISPPTPFQFQFQFWFWILGFGGFEPNASFVPGIEICDVCNLDIWICWDFPKISLHFINTKMSSFFMWLSTNKDSHVLKLLVRCFKNSTF